MDICTYTFFSLSSKEVCCVLVSIDRLIRSVGHGADGHVLFQFRDEGPVAAGPIGLQLQLHVLCLRGILNLGLADVEKQFSKYIV